MTKGYDEAFRPINSAQSSWDAASERVYLSQPKPTPNNNHATWGLVIADMAMRNNIGVQKYGTPLQPFNGRNSLQDAYEEVLDLAVYLKNAIIEMETK